MRSFAMAMAVVAVLGTSMTLARARGVTKQTWGKTAAGEAVDLYTLTNAKGASVQIATLGGTVVSVTVPDKTGALGNVVLGFDSLDGYLAPHPFFGVLVGRYGNRIGQGRFTLDGKAYTLAKNNGENSLHGGIKGFDKYVWKTREVASPDGVAVELTHMSPDGDEGFPGTLSATVRYTWTDANGLRIDYTATTDKPTVLNLTNHSYFNLSAGSAATVLDHTLQLTADKFTPVDKGLIPTGELRPVAGTPFDFTKARRIGELIDKDDEQIKFGGGYDHNFVFSRPADGSLRPAGRVTEPTSGRDDGRRHDGAGRAVLHRQFPGRVDQGARGQALHQAQRLVPRNAALPRLTEQAGLSVGGAEAGPDLQDEHLIHVQCGEMITTTMTR